MSTHINIVVLVGKITDYDADMHIVTEHVRLGIVSKILLLNEQCRCTDKVVV
jgi:hypothetical protein